LQGLASVIICNGTGSSQHSKDTTLIPVTTLILTVDKGTFHVDHTLHLQNKKQLHQARQHELKSRHDHVGTGITGIILAANIGTVYVDVTNGALATQRNNRIK
jgi:hypothetical protein